MVASWIAAAVFRLANRSPMLMPWIVRALTPDRTAIFLMMRLLTPRGSPFSLCLTM